VILPLDDVRAVRRAAGVTVDAVMLAVTGGALRSYLGGIGDLPDRSLTANVPMASELGGAADRPWGNYFANYLATLATDEPDPWARLLRIGEVATESRERLEILGLDTIVRWLDYVPSLIGEPGGAKVGDYRRSHPEKIDFSVLMSNFPGPRERLGFCGVQLDHMYVSGPTTDGEGLNITAWSYCDEVALVVLAHAEALAEPQRFVDGFRTALAELVEAARAHAGGD
jgi:diacylglycerol O-acyltransferase